MVRAMVRLDAYVLLLTFGYKAGECIKIIKLSTY